MACTQSCQGQVLRTGTPGLDRSTLLFASYGRPVAHQGKGAAMRMAPVPASTAEWLAARVDALRRFVALVDDSHREHVTAHLEKAPKAESAIRTTIGPSPHERRMCAWMDEGAAAAERRWDPGARSTACRLATGPRAPAAAVDDLELDVSSQRSSTS